MLAFAGKANLVFEAVDLRLIAEEQRARAAGLEQATFGMYCFWSGEAKLGRLEGVITTEPGFLSGSEVVEVLYDPDRITFQDLAERAQQSGAATQVFTRSDQQQAVASGVRGLSTSRTDAVSRPSRSDDKYQLAHSTLRFVPMTPLQATRVNAALSQRRDAQRLLSPQQRRLGALVTAHPDAGWTSQIGSSDLQAAMTEAHRVAAQAR